MPRNRLPDVLVSSAWLNENLGAPDLRVVECTTFLEDTEPGADVPYDPRPGRAEYEAAHIEGAVFADLVADLSRPDAATHFMLPQPAAFAESMGRLGIGDGTRVVVYSRFPPMWATRLWWMLRVMGFETPRSSTAASSAGRRRGGRSGTGPSALPRQPSRRVLDRS